NQLDARSAANAACEVASRLDPLWPGKFTVKSWKLATDPDVNLRDPRLAYELASQAAQANDDPSAATLDAFAAAQAALRRFPEAVQTAKQALKKASAANDSGLAGAIQEHLRRYERGEPVTSNQQ